MLIDCNKTKTNIKNKNKLKSIKRKGGIILDDLYYGKCIHPYSLLDIYIKHDNSNFEISIENLLKKYFNIYPEYDGLGYWYKPNKSLYINSYNIGKKRYENKKILKLYKQFINEKLKCITLDNDFVIKSTLIHRFYIIRNKNIKWENKIEKDDLLLCKNKEKLEFIKIKSIHYIDYEGPVYDLTIAKNKNYFANNILCHNTSHNFLDINNRKNYFIIVSNYRLNYWKKNIKNYHVINEKKDLTKKNNLLILKKNYENFGYEFKKKNYNLIVDCDNFKIDKKKYDLYKNFNLKWFIVNNYNSKLIKKNFFNNFVFYFFNNNKNLIYKNDTVFIYSKNINYRFINFSLDEKELYDNYINKFKNFYKNKNILFDDDYLKKYCCFPKGKLSFNIFNINNNFLKKLGKYGNIIIEKIKNIENNKSICSICLNNIEKDNLGITECGHIFCYSCIDKSIKVDSKCPECRKDTCEKDIYLYREYETSLIDYSIFNDLGSKFIYLFRMIDNLKNVIIFSNYDENLIFINNFLKKFNIDSYLLNNKININYLNNTNNNILLVNYSLDIKKLYLLKKKYNLIFLTPYYINNLLSEKYDEINLKYLNIFTVLEKNIIEIYFLVMKNTIEEKYIKYISI